MRSRETPEARQRPRVVEVGAGVERRERDGAVHRARIEVAVAEAARNLARHRGLACPGGAVDRDHHLSMQGRRSLTRTGGSGRHADDRNAARELAARLAEGAVRAPRRRARGAARRLRRRPRTRGRARRVPDRQLRQHAREARGAARAATGCASCTPWRSRRRSCGSTRTASSAAAAARPCAGATCRCSTSSWRCPSLATHPSLTFEVVLVRVEEHRVDAPRTRRRRKPWRVVDRVLVEVLESRVFGGAAGLASVLPPGLPELFTTLELAAGARDPARSRPEDRLHAARGRHHRGSGPRAAAPSRTDVSEPRAARARPANPG